MLNQWVGRFAAIVLVAVGLATGAGCKSKRHEEPLLPGVSTGAAVQIQSNSVVRRSLAETRDAMAAIYRLGPDHRLLDAVAYLDIRVAGNRAATVDARFANGAWQVKYRDQDVGSLPEVPSYEDGERLLGVWAGRLLKEHPMSRVSEEAARDTPDAVGLLFDDIAVDALHRAESLFGNPAQQGNAIRLAAGAVSSLVFQLVDKMQTADELYARAWGLVALEQALGANAHADRVLLAESLGYHASAKKIAAELPENHPVRAYAMRDDARLQDLASKRDATTGTRFLWLVRLLRRDKVAEATEARKRWFGGLDSRTPLLLFRLDSTDFATMRALAPMGPAVVLLEASIRSHGERASRAESIARSVVADDRVTAAKISAGLGIEPGQIIEAFDEELTRLNDAGGALGAGPILREYYKAAMYSALRALGQMYLRTLASNEASKQFASSLGTNGGQTAAQFKLWYDYLVTSKSGVNVTGELVDKVQTLVGFGAQPLTDLFDELLNRLEWGSPVGLTAARKVLARMDTRVSNRAFVARAANDGLLDLKLTEKMYRSAVETAPGIYPDVESWLARYTADPKLGAEALSLPDLPAEDRMDLLALRETTGAATADATLAELTRIAASERWRWATQKRLIDYLMEKKQFDEAERVAREWLKPNASAPGLDPIFAKIAIAKSLRALGRNDEALRAVGPAAGSWQGGAMYQTAVLLSMSGDKARAKELMLARLERYPVPESLAGVAELHWRLGDYPAAAQALASTTIPLRLVDWRDAIGSAFAEVFVRSKIPGSISAFEAMKRAHIPPMNLMQMAQGAHFAGDDRVMLDLLTRIDDPKVQVAAAFRALPIMKRLDGDATATAWATSKLRAGPALTVASLCVADDCDDAIWLLEEPPPGENRDLFWLFRAVVVARHHDSPHRVEVLKYFQANGTGRYFVMGRAVMALEDESAVTGFAGDIHQVCEVAFYLGAAAEGQGRIEDASDWYRAALETNLIRENEYHFAYNRLAAWRSQGKSLGRIAADAH